MEEVQPRLTLGDVFGYVLAYTCWILTALVSMAAILLFRDAGNALWPVLGGSRWVLRAVDRFGLVFLGLAWLVYVIFVEQYYRSSITQVRIRRMKARARAAASVGPKPENKALRRLRRLGLDILVRRLIPTLLAPLAVTLLSYLLRELAFVLLRTV